MKIELDLAQHLAAPTPPEETVDQQLVDAAAEWVCKNYKIETLTVSVSIVDDPTIHALNNEHLQHDWPTDVISFVFSSENGVVDGEIIASVDTARRLAEQTEWRTKDELLLYIVHGLLHLAGLDDQTDDQQEEMRQAEQRCLVELGIQGADSHINRWEDIGD